VHQNLSDNLDNQADFDRGRSARDVRRPQPASAGRASSAPSLPRHTMVNCSTVPRRARNVPLSSQLNELGSQTLKEFWWQEPVVDARFTPSDGSQVESGHVKTLTSSRMTQERSLSRPRCSLTRSGISIATLGSFGGERVIGATATCLRPPDPNFNPNGHMNGNWGELQLVRPQP
jgi:hypothetical protein